MLDTFQWRMKWRKFWVQLKKKETKEKFYAKWKRPLRDVSLFLGALGMLLWFLRPAASEKEKNYFSTPEEVIAVQKAKEKSATSEANSPSSPPGSGPGEKSNYIDCGDSPESFGAQPLESGNPNYYACPANLPAEPVCMHYRKPRSLFPHVTHQTTCKNACSCCLYQHYAQQYQPPGSLQFLGYVEGPCEKSKPFPELEISEPQFAPPAESEVPTQDSPHLRGNDNRIPSTRRPPTVNDPRGFRGQEGQGGPQP